MRARPGPGPRRRLDRLEDELVTLARSGGALRRVLAAVSGRLVAQRAWERLGFARLADYARERAGVSARQLQDLAHVDGRLAELPELEAALVAGRLPWTKVRLLARVATAADEGRWLAYARRVTVRALEREVRAVDLGSVEAGRALPAVAGDADEADGERRENVVLRCTPRVRAKWQRARTIARRVAGEALPMWQCMEAVAAEVLSALPLEGEPPGLPEPPDAPEPPGLPEPPPAPEPHDAPRPPHAANVCAPHASGKEHPPGPPDAAPAPPAEPPVFLRPLLARLERADAFELDARLRRLIALEQQLDSRIGPLLLRLAESRAYGPAGTHVEAFARDQLGISPRKARMLLRIERAGRRCPALREAHRDGRLSWVQAHTLVPLLLLPGLGAARARDWIARAAAVTVRRLDDDVAHALTLHETDPRAFAASAGLPEPGRLGDPGTPGEPAERTRSDPTWQTCAPRSQSGGDTAEPETARLFFNAPREVARLFRAVLCSVQHRLERRSGRLPTPGQALDAMLDHAFDTWGARNHRVPAAHRVFERDGWRCTAPGCSSYRNLHDHHIRFRSAGGSHAPSNRTTLCAWHHLRGVHAGLMRCRGTAPGGLRFELGIRPGRPPLAAFRSGDERADPVP